MSAEIDFAGIIEPVARELLGDPNRALSSRTELRFGSRGSVSVVIAGDGRGTWFDHETSVGGGVLDLIRHKAGRANGAALDWLRERGFVEAETPHDRAGAPRIVATYDYHDESGVLVYQVVRREPKDFRQRRPDGHGGWIWNLQGVVRVLYRLPELLQAAPDAPVYVVEGEKDADLLAERGLIATTNAGGAKKWLPDYADALRGRHVVILPDNDEAGAEHAEDVAQRLVGAAASVKILRLPGLPPKGDVADWLSHCGTVEELEELAAQAQERQPAADQEQTDGKPARFRLVDPTALAGLRVPPREWIVEDWLPVDCCTANYGDGGTGKTLLAQQLMSSTATGAPWAGQQTARCRSIGLFCEDSEDELHRRQAAINAALGLDFTDLPEMRWISGAGGDNTLARFLHDGRMLETEFWKSIRQAAIDFGARLVVLDTAADLFAGNENDRQQVRRFIAMLNGLAMEINGAVLLNAHPSRAGMNTGTLDGGSTAWSNTVRSRWSLARPQSQGDAEEDPDERILTRRKANYAAQGDTIKLRWRAGALVLPWAAAPGASGSPQPSAAMQAEQCEEVFLRLLDKCDLEKQRVCASVTANNFAPTVFAKRPDREGFTKREFRAAMQRLFERKAIQTEQYGRPGDARFRLVRGVSEDAETAA